jgi:hypothetical protein
MKTSELTGAALDWAVAKCEGINYEVIDGGLDYDCPDYSTHWAQGGPIIEREKIEIFIRDEGWFAYSSFSTPEDFPGPTPLIAAMRCYVASKLGDEVDVPEELT